MALVKTGPKVQFSQLCWQKMWALVHACDIEISWIMQRATDDEKKAAGVDADFYFVDTHLVDQVCSGVKSDMKPEAFGNLVSELMDQGVDPSLLIGWGHSHVNMSTSFSGTDEATVERLQLEPLISIILNKKGEVNLRCDVWEPWRYSYECTYSVDQIKMIADSWGSDMVKEHVEKEKIVSKIKTVKTGFNGTGFGYQTYPYNSYNWGGKKKQEEEEVEDLFIDAELNLPEKYKFVEECYLEGVIDINEVVEYVSDVRLGNKTIEEVEDELNQLFMETGNPDKDTPVAYEDEFDFEDAQLAYGGVK